MAKFRRMPFPRYINRERLWIYFEEDEVKFFFIILIIVVGFSFLMALPIFFMVVIVSLVEYFAMKIYKKMKKRNAKGFMEHYFYSMGIKEYKTKHKDKCHYEIPYGFVKRFRN